MQSAIFIISSLLNVECSPSEVINDLQLSVERNLYAAYLDHNVGFKNFLDTGTLPEITEYSQFSVQFKKIRNIFYRELQDVHGFVELSHQIPTLIKLNKGELVRIDNTHENLISFLDTHKDSFKFFKEESKLPTSNTVSTIFQSSLRFLHDNVSTLIGTCSNWSEFRFNLPFLLHQSISMRWGHHYDLFREVFVNMSIDDLLIANYASHENRSMSFLDLYFRPLLNKHMQSTILCFFNIDISKEKRFVEDDFLLSRIFTVKHYHWHAILGSASYKDYKYTCSHYNALKQAIFPFSQKIFILQKDDFESIKSLSPLITNLYPSHFRDTFHDKLSLQINAFMLILQNHPTEKQSLQYLRFLYLETNFKLIRFNKSLIKGLLRQYPFFTFDEECLTTFQCVESIMIVGVEDDDTPSNQFILQKFPKSFQEISAFLDKPYMLPATKLIRIFSEYISVGILNMDLVQCFQIVVNIFPSLEYTEVLDDIKGILSTLDNQ